MIYWEITRHRGYVHALREADFVHFGGETVP